MIGQTKQIYEFGPFRLIPQERQLLRDGQSVPLSPKAFDLLLALVEHSGHLVEKDDLLKQVWPDTFVEEANLSVKLSALRRALGEAPGDDQYIETVPKRGYRFVASVRTRQEFDTQFEDSADPPMINDARQPEEPRNKRARQLNAPYSAAAKRHSSAKTAPSIAVLPFVNLSSDSENEYFCDGLAEDLLNALAKIETLHVAARTSAFSFKGKQGDVREVGQKLNVSAVLEGSVRKAGNRLRVTAQLINVADGYHLWSGRYDRQIEDILDIQDDISVAIVDALKVKLLSDAHRQAIRRYTDNVDAYQLYLKGRYEWNKFTLTGLQESIRHYNQAIEKDPNYALAYEGLARSYWVLGNSYWPPKETYPKAKAYALAAVGIDDTLGQSHSMMGAVRMHYDWDWVEAEKEIRCALDLDPNHPQGHLLYACYLEAMGRTTEAISEAKRAEQLDPFSPLTITEVACSFFYARRYDEAIEEARKVLDLDPQFFITYLILGQAFERKGLHAQAIKELLAGIDVVGRYPPLIASLGYTYAMLDRRSEAEEVLCELTARSKENYVSPYFLALVYAGLDDKNKAFAALEKAYEDRYFLLTFLEVEPQFDGLRSDPRFTQFLQRMGLPEQTGRATTAPRPGINRRPSQGAPTQS